MAEAPENDVLCWFVFILVLSALLGFDAVYLAPVHVQRMPNQIANKMSGFWLSIGLAFSCWIWMRSGWDNASGFLQGFFLEYMLSFDNLFVFHMIFVHYCTPDALLYRALYFGIAGAIVLRILMISVGYSLVNTGVYLVKVCFGIALIYSGYKSAVMEHEEDPDVAKTNQCASIMTKVLPISDHYEPRGHFFMDVEDRGDGPSEMFFDRARQIEPRDRSNSLDGLLSTPSIDSESAVANLPRLESFEGSSLLRDAPSREVTASRPAAVPAAAPRPDRRHFRVKASLLLLVVIALWGVDLVFAMDSVASKLASVNDIFLNVSSSAFALPLYFVMENMVQSFHMLKYGIAAILVLIGLKMVLSVWFNISNSATFVLILLICGTSMAFSYWLPADQQILRGIEEDVLETVPEGEETTAFEQAEELEPMTPSRPVALPVNFNEDVD